MFSHIPTDIPKCIRLDLPGGPRLYKTSEGKRYPSITTILSAKEQPELVQWRERMGAQRAAAEMKRGANRGTAVHKLVEGYLSNQPIQTITQGETPANISLFNRLKTRLNSIDNIRAIETAFYSDVIGIAGTVDCIAEYDGVLSVLDFKTANKIRTKDMIEDYFLQTTAYSLMWREHTTDEIEDIVIIIVAEEGLAPTVYKEKIHKYIKPLMKRIKEYQTKGAK